MHVAISIDPKNGHILFGQLEITPKTTTTDLNNVFTIGKEMLVTVLGKKVPCRFLQSEIQGEGLKFELNLRFESGVLVSVFIGITDPLIPTHTDEEFYNSLEAVKNLHEHWLKGQIGIVSTGHKRFKWGIAGVAQDKSDNIYIYLHNRNNTWAFDN